MLIGRSNSSYSTMRFVARVFCHKTDYVSLSIFNRQQYGIRWWNRPRNSLQKVVQYIKHVTLSLSRMPLCKPLILRGGGKMFILNVGDPLNDIYELSDFLKKWNSCIVFYAWDHNAATITSMTSKRGTHWVLLVTESGSAVAAKIEQSAWYKLDKIRILMDEIIMLTH